MKVKLNKIMTKGKAFYLAYDQGMEHGPVEFNDKNVDPRYIIEIAQKGKFNAMIFQKGIAEKYNKEIKKSKVPLIIKLNGKTSLSQTEPLSKQICSVKEALKLGAVAVGYTIYIGSDYENIMLKEFDTIEKEAHARGIPVIAWIYPRGKGVKGKSPVELMAYAARVGLEIGADIVKLKREGDLHDLHWTVQCAGKTKVVVAGGIKEEEGAFLRDIRDVMRAGAMGVAVGRNIWKAKNPFELSKRAREIVFNKYS
ncbi:MAG: fructose-bisphosphate aldolase [Nanoarchaeota archaeon]|nr:fructose-bisphosphate aldolase [Nanoarchaeota archaeon]